MRFISIVLIFVATTMASGSDNKPYYDIGDAKTLFEEFIQKHNKQYKDDADKEEHFRAFVSNLGKINKLNENNPSATYGINKFADYTEKERQGMFGLRKPNAGD